MSKPSKPTRQLSFWAFKILMWFTIIDYTVQNTLQNLALHSLIFYKDAYQHRVGLYIVILTDAQSFFPGILFYCFTIIVQINQI